MLVGLLKCCALLFFGRVADMTFSTFRTVLTVKEKPLAAACMGFVEVVIWFMVVRDALSSDYPTIWLALAYAGGFAVGTYVGGKLARIFVKGHVTVEVITSDRSDTLPNAMRQAGYVLTVINVNESEFGQKKYLILADVNKRKVEYFESRVKELDPGAFIMVRDTKSYIYGNRVSRK